MPTILNQGSWCPRPRDPAAYIVALLSELSHPDYILDPSFEHNGNFIIPDPSHYHTGVPLYPLASVQFFGNFLTHSGVFNLVTDDPETIAALTAAIRTHQQTERYLAHRPPQPPSPSPALQQLPLL